MDQLHSRSHVELPRGDSPVLVEIWRGNMVESRHRAIAAVVDAAGGVVQAWGDIRQPIYGRSSIKPLLAIPLVESGAADRYGLGEREIALACASHSGEPGHVGAVNDWLARIGCSAGDLECGTQYPSHEPSLHAMVRSGEVPTPAHNNCSGKHTGFLSTAIHLGEPIAGYIRYEHSVQQRLLGVLEQMCGQDLSAVPRGVDGCGIPVIAIPVGHHALAMARMADPGNLSAGRAAACRRILAAMSLQPWHVAGTGRFCTDVMRVTGRKAAIKTGAEGVYMAALPELGFGVCIKIEDGNGRGAELVMGQLLRHFGIIDAGTAEQLKECLQPTLKNRAGAVTGDVRPSPLLASTAGF